ncbi:MAG: thiamine-phosphate kinase, partial [Pseudonocardiaceae bacterium]
ASGVGIDIDSAALPVASLLVEVASALDADARHWVLTGGEDHALLASFPAGVALPVGWTEIGVVREGRGVTVDGGEVLPRDEVLPAGWQHFS